VVSPGAHPGGQPVAPKLRSSEGGSRHRRRRRRSRPRTISISIASIEYAFDTDEPMLGRPPAGDVE
jgi:hypothetical protein